MHKRCKQTGEYLPNLFSQAKRTNLVKKGKQCPFTRCLNKKNNKTTVSVIRDNI